MWLINTLESLLMLWCNEFAIPEQRTELCHSLLFLFVMESGGARQQPKVKHRQTHHIIFIARNIHTSSPVVRRSFILTRLLTAKFPFFACTYLLFCHFCCPQQTQFYRKFICWYVVVSFCVLSSYYYAHIFFCTLSFLSIIFWNGTCAPLVHILWIHR